MKINIVYQFNEKYAPYAGVSMESVCKNNVHFDQISFYILGEKLSPKSEERLRMGVEKYSREIYFIHSEQLMEQMKEWKLPTYRGSYSANLRMFLSQLLPKTVEKVLYLDADTIVAGELDELASLDMGKYAMAMVQDSLGEKHKKILGFQKDEKYYNSGVILFDMRNWNQYHLSERIKEHILQVRAQYPSPDQDLLNIVCKQYIMALDIAYNLQPVHKAFSLKIYQKVYSSLTYYDGNAIERALKHPIIHHIYRFIGEFPWDADNTHPDTELFDRYLKDSEWKDYHKKVIKASIATKIEKELYKLLPGNIFLIIFKIAHDRFFVQADRLSKKNEIDRRM